MAGRSLSKTARQRAKSLGRGAVPADRRVAGDFQGVKVAFISLLPSNKELLSNNRRFLLSRNSLLSSNGWLLLSCRRLQLGNKKFLPNNIPLQLSSNRLLPSQTRLLSSKHCCKVNGSCQLVATFMKQLHLMMSQMEDRMCQELLTFRRQTILDRQTVSNSRLSVFHTEVSCRPFPCLFCQADLSLSSLNPQITSRILLSSLLRVLTIKSINLLWAACI